ncbi:MAG: hypothetical protein ACHP65_03030 [Legionellales bacterium]
MFKDLHITHLTGTATVHKNQLLQDIISYDKPRRTTGQMFFQPYESKEEFIFCARNTLLPAAIVGLSIINPVVLITTPVIFLSASLLAAAIGGVYACLGDYASTTEALEFAEEIVAHLCQAIINILVLPLSALVMLTRGISTGLKAADIYDFDDFDNVDAPVSLAI